MSGFSSRNISSIHKTICDSNSKYDRYIRLHSQFTVHRYGRLKVIFKTILNKLEETFMLFPLHFAKESN